MLRLALLILTLVTSFYVFHISVMPAAPGEKFQGVRKEKVKEGIIV